MPRGRIQAIIARAPALRGLAGNPEWEAMKGRCRNLRPADAVRECGYLSAQYRKRFAMPEIDWQKIVSALQAKKIPFVLTGLAFRRALGAFAVVKRHYALVTRLGGGLLVAIGVLLVTGVWDKIVIHLQVVVSSTQTVV